MRGAPRANLAVTAAWRYCIEGTKKNMMVAEEPKKEGPRRAKFC